MKRFYDNNEAAAWLGLKPQTLPARRNRGQGPAFIRVGRKVLYDIADLEAFVAAGRVEPKQAAE